jgi:hypothetical protein
MDIAGRTRRALVERQDIRLAYLFGSTAAGTARPDSDTGWRAVILGQLDGILTGIRQLRRTRPLETEEIAGPRVPTLAEMARIKAWLLTIRHTVRDYLDTVVLFERLGEEGVVLAVRPFDEIYRQSATTSPLAEVAERLGAGSRADRSGAGRMMADAIAHPRAVEPRCTGPGQ